MSLLTIVQNVAASLNVVIPTSIVGNSNADARQWLALANRAGKEVTRRHDWHSLIVDHEWAAVGREAQSDALPADYDHLIPDVEVWDRTNNVKLSGPTSAFEWQRLVSSGVTGSSVGWWRLIGGKLHIFPAPTVIVLTLLHFDGNDQSTLITDDVSAHTWTANGNAQIDTAVSKFGGASALFDGTGDYSVTSDNEVFTLGSGDWTIACWFNCTATINSQKGLAGQMDSVTGLNTKRSFDILRNNSTEGDGIGAEVYIGASNFKISGTTKFTDLLNPGWHHMAFVRDENTLRLFIDGVQENSMVISGSVNDSISTLGVGGWNDSSFSISWQGSIDEFSISSVALWTSNFTPPTSAGSADITTYSLEYVSKNWCQSVIGVGQAAWAADTDTGIVSEELIELGLTWRYLRAKGMDYAEELSTYEREIEKASARDRGIRVMVVDRQADRFTSWPGTVTT